MSRWAVESIRKEFCLAVHKAPEMKRAYTNFSDAARVEGESEPAKSSIFTCTDICRTLLDMGSQSVTAREFKKERLETRLTPQQKKRIERAARIKGTSLSDFVVLSADDAALRVIREQETLTLTERASEVFVDALLNPPAPGRRLAVAAKRFRARTGT
jgi:uncharacterized protein (DUF1778 family)